MIFVLLLSIIFLLGIFLVAKKLRNGNQKQNLPPGPWGLPLLGHLVSLGLNPHLTLMKWKKRYGPIISCRFGSFPTVVLCDSKVIKEAFAMAEFSGRPLLQAWTENGHFKGIVFSEGSYNTELRNFVMKKLKEFGAGRKTLNNEIHQGISEFMDFIKLREGLPIKSEDVPSAHIIRTLWSIMMTEELNPEEIEHLRNLVLKVAELGPVLSELAGFLPWMEKITRTLSLGHFSLIAPRSRTIIELYSLVSTMLQPKEQLWVKGQGQHQGPGDLNGDMVETYFAKRREAEIQQAVDCPFHPSYNSLTPIVVDMLAAAIHTTRITLVWMLFYLAKNQEVQFKLHEEIEEVIGKWRLPSLLDRGQMSYADAFIHETLRITSVVSLALPHKTTSDIRFHGYNIKKDTMVFANFYGVHHDPEIWDQPGIFRPERWLGEQGKKHKSEHFFPFSTGRRVCPGEALAREQLFLYVTTLLQRYNIDFNLGKVPEVKAVFGNTLVPSSFTVVFTPRKLTKT